MTNRRRCPVPRAGALLRLPRPRAGALLPAPSVPALAGAATVLLLGLAAAPPAPAQEGEEPRRGRQCTLRWEPRTDSTASRSIETGTDAFTHYVWNGMRWTCGGAVILADSAVQYEAEGRVEMYENVHYRDSIRVLDARELTYLRGNELVVAREDVHLTRLASGSTLEGPYVEFYRAGSGRIERTVAVERPHLTVFPGGDTTGGGSGDEEPEPYHVDGDTVIIHGETETEARGNVVVTRNDLRATGARALFDTRAGRGKLWGGPETRSEDFHLAGDTIRLAMDAGEVRMIHAVENGHLTGDDLDVRGREVRVLLDGRRVEMLWSYGGSISTAVSAGREMSGDSLRFAFRDGRPDTAVAVGRAAAVEVDTAGRDRPGGGRPVLDVERNWIVGDTVVAVFEPEDAEPGEDAAVPATADSGGAATDSTGRVRMRQLTATGSARAFYRVAPDTADADATDEGMARNYMIGDVIVVTFREGEPHRVRGQRAIGVYAEPEEGAGTRPGPGPRRPDARPTPARDTAGSGAAPPDTVPPDSTAQDSTTQESTAPEPAPPDTVPADSTSRDPGEGS